MLDFEPLKNSFSGEIVSHVHSNYDEARSVYNANIDKKPEGILFCKNQADVISAVNFARDAGATIAVRCQGHNGSGHSTCDDGVIIDLSGMDVVRRFVFLLPTSFCVNMYKNYQLDVMKRIREIFWPI